MQERSLSNAYIGPDNRVHICVHRASRCARIPRVYGRWSVGTSGIIIRVSGFESLLRHSLDR
jgi:hypothetical protein